MGATWKLPVSPWPGSWEPKLKEGACIDYGNVIVIVLVLVTDKETDESWDIFIIPMKNQFWAGLGS